MLASDHWDVQPDILCLGKGLNAGYFPISAVLVNSEVHGILKQSDTGFSLGHTHSNHPLGAAIANAVLDVLESEYLVQRVCGNSDLIRDQLKRELSDINHVFDIRGKGYLWGIELADPATGMPLEAFQNLAGEVVSVAFEAGLLLYPARGFVDGISGDAIIFAPH